MKISEVIKSKGSKPFYNIPAGALFADDPAGGAEQKKAGAFQVEV